MPIYSYVCENCGKEDMVVKPMSQYDRPETCPVCGQLMYRDIAADAPRVHGKRYYDKPLHSDSLAMARSQVAAHQRRWPDIEIDVDCRPVFKSYKQHDDYLKDTGHVKMPQIVRHRFAKKK